MLAMKLRAIGGGVTPLDFSYVTDYFFSSATGSSITQASASVGPAEDKTVFAFVMVEDISAVSSSGYITGVTFAGSPMTLVAKEYSASSFIIAMFKIETSATSGNISVSLDASRSYNSARIHTGYIPAQGITEHDTSTSKSFTGEPSLSIDTANKGVLVAFQFGNEPNHGSNAPVTFSMTGETMETLDTSGGTVFVALSKSELTAAGTKTLSSSISGDSSYAWILLAAVYTS